MGLLCTLAPPHASSSPRLEHCTARACFARREPALHGVSAACFARCEPALHGLSCVLEQRCTVRSVGECGLDGLPTLTLTLTLTPTLTLTLTLTLTRPWQESAASTGCRRAKADPSRPCTTSCPSSPPLEHIGLQARVHRVAGPITYGCRPSYTRLQVFAATLRLAAELSRPVSLHCVRAPQACNRV